MSLIQTLRLPGPAGPLEAILKRPAGGSPPFAAVVCHPHPLHGGTMHSKVVFNVAKALEERGAAVLRFNFRGVGRSGGAHAEGVGEREDVRAALTFLAGLHPGLPLCLGGFSFGAWVGSAVGCADPRVTQLVAVGTPTRLFDSDALLHCPKRKLFVQGGADEHGPAPELASVVESLAPPKELRVVEGADHFFSGRTDELRAVLADYFAREGDPPAPTQIVRGRGPSNSQR
ncbi:MAG: alpha/beta hydrolase [Gemmatimonadota bacterium]